MARAVAPVQIVDFRGTQAEVANKKPRRGRLLTSEVILRARNWRVAFLRDDAGFRAPRGTFAERYLRICSV